MPRVLVFTPTYGGLLEPETVKSIAAMRFDGFDHVISEENPYPGRDMRNTLFQFLKGRRLALEGGYDALLSVEHDMIVPADALEKMWDTDAGVVYGAYQFRHKSTLINLFRYEGAHDIGMSLSRYKRDLQYARRIGWIRVSGAGFGCTLFRRSVLEAVPFRSTGNAPDMPFATDCVQRGIRQVGRTDVVCGHIDRVWAKRTLWPFDERSIGMAIKVIALQSVTILDDGKAVAMEVGQEYIIGETAAEEFTRAGFVRVIDRNGARETATAEKRETATAPAAKRKPKPKRATT